MCAESFRTLQVCTPLHQRSLFPQNGIACWLEHVLKYCHLDNRVDKALSHLVWSSTEFHSLVQLNAPPRPPPPPRIITLLNIPISLHFQDKHLAFFSRAMSVYLLTGAVAHPATSRNLHDWDTDAGSLLCQTGSTARHPVSKVQSPDSEKSGRMRHDICIWAADKKLKVLLPTVLRT